MYVEVFVMIIGFTTLQRQNCLLVSGKVFPEVSALIGSSRRGSGTVGARAPIAKYG